MTYLIRLPLASALLAAVVLALAPWSASAAGGCAGADAEPSRATEDQAATATLCLLNAERAERGLGRLGRDDRLAAAAQRHARDMVARSYFAHVSPAGSSPLDRIRTTGYIPSAGRWIVGENLGWGTGRMATPREIVAAWMGSPTHRANVLQGRYREIGLGVLTGNPKRTDGRGATYVTTFGGIGPTARGARTTIAAAKARARHRRARRCARRMVRRAGKARLRCAAKPRRA